MSREPRYVRFPTLATTKRNYLIYLKYTSDNSSACMFDTDDILSAQEFMATPRHVAYSYRINFYETIQIHLLISFAV